MNKIPLFISKSGLNVKTSDDFQVFRMGEPYKGEVFEVKLRNLKVKQPGTQDVKPVEEIFDAKEIEKVEDKIKKKGIMAKAGV